LIHRRGPLNNYTRKWPLRLIAAQLPPVACSNLGIEWPVSHSRQRSGFGAAGRNEVGN